jgi:hypothetical protein
VEKGVSGQVKDESHVDFSGIKDVVDHELLLKSGVNSEPLVLS